MSFGLHTAGNSAGDRMNVSKLPSWQKLSNTRRSVRPTQDQIQASRPPHGTLHDRMQSNSWD